MKILLIEDDRRVIKDVSVCLHIRYPDAIVISAAEGRQGMEMAEEEAPDLVMVASSLPDIDSYHLMRKIRDFSDVPLIVLLEGQTDIDRAGCLEEGADDYVSKPISPIELLAKINAVLRRMHKLGFTPMHSVSLGNKFLINFATREVFILGKPVKLTPTEYSLLSELVRNEGRVLSHRALLEKGWGSEYVDDSSFVKKYIYRLRSKIEQNARKPQMLLAERGIGYRFVRPV